MAVDYHREVAVQTGSGGKQLMLTVLVVATRHVVETVSRDLVVKHGSLKWFEGLGRQQWKKLGRNLRMDWGEAQARKQARDDLKDLG